MRFPFLRAGAPLARVYRDPVSWAILLVDLFPVYAVVQLGWDAGALVFLYWLENLVLGLIALLRVAAASAMLGWPGLGVFAVLGPFFTVHYGMFCFVHGIFLMVFAAMGGGGGIEEPDPANLIDYALGTGQHMMTFVGLILALQLFLFGRDDLLRGEYRNSDPMTEMFKPYDRIVALHLSLFAGFGLLLLLGQPMIGVLALIVLRAVWGVKLAVQRWRQLEGSQINKVDGASPI